MSWTTAHPLTTLACTNSARVEQLFDVRVEGGVDGRFAVWQVYVRPKDVGEIMDDRYVASFREVEPHLFQLDFVTNDLPTQYKGYGITRALIPAISKFYSARVRSSKHDPSEDETQSVAAKRIWQRMVDEGIAHYDSSDDRYYYPGTDAK